MIKVTNEVKVYESEGKTPETADLSIQICSHWNRNEMVVFITPGGAKLTMLARDLEAAIKNATNNVRHYPHETDCPVLVVRDVLTP